MYTPLETTKTAAELMQLWNDHPTRGGKGEAVGCPSRNSRLVAALRAMNVTASFRWALAGAAGAARGLF